MPSGKYQRLARITKLEFDLVTAARLTRAAQKGGDTVAAMLTAWVQHNLDTIDPDGVTPPAEAP